MGNGSASNSALHVGMTCEAPGSSGEPGVGSQESGIAPAEYLRYQWRTACRKGGPDCGVLGACVDPDARLWQLWGLAADDHQWYYITSECVAGDPSAAQIPLPRITPAQVLSAIRRIGLPQLTVHVQPEGTTLVNFDTNFYVVPQDFSRTITLLGRSVAVDATPTQYTWVHGDGSSAATSEPGAPYPQLDVTYAYRHKGTVTTHVQVTYSARFRVEGGSWQQIPDTVTVDGPPTTLQVSEATGLLSGDYQ